MDWPSATTPDTAWEADTLHSDTTSYFSADRHYARTLPQHLPSPTQHRALQPTSIPPHTSTRYGNRHGLVCAPAIYDETCDQVQPSCHLSPSLSRVEMLLTQAALLTDMGTDPLTQAQSLLNEWADNAYSNVLTHTMDDDDDTMMDSFPDCHGAGSAADDVSRMVLRRVYQTTRSTDTARASPAWGIAVDDRDSNILDSSHMRSDSDRNDFSELARSLVDTVTTTPTSKEKKLVRNTGCVAPSDLRLGIAARQQAVQERKQALALQRNKEIQARIYQKEVQQTRRQQQLHEQQQAVRALQLEREITAKMMKDQETERQLDAAIQAIDTQNARKVVIQEEAIERESEASINGARKQILKNQTYHLEIITRRIESITTLRNLKLLKILDTLDGFISIIVSRKEENRVAGYVDTSAVSNYKGSSISSEASTFTSISITEMEVQTQSRKEIADQLEKRHQAAELVKAKMEHEAIEEKERQRQEIIKLRKKAEEEAHMRLVQVNTHYQLSIQTIAVQTHAKRRLYQSISTWKSRLDTYRGLFTRASQSLTQRVMLGHFLRWMGSYHVKAAKRRAEEDQKCQLADVLASRIVSRRYIQRWKQFVDIQKDNRWREFQRLQLQAKVKSILDESGSLERVLESTTMDLGWSYT
ncbi:hypothetical protein BASA81_015512 [Batrachochytrium salamandrivorans]|nr:hypothetical protein BASA81_015512 [Batrachochytrium salamandrivorans]